jgi:hypothetical protein
MGIIRIGSGDFTMLKYIENLGAADLERTVGFHKGRLDSGFLIVVLAENEIIRASDFDLKASTGSSGGKMACVDGDNITDVLRGRGQDPDALKKKVANFFLRCKANYPAKVLPNRRHDELCKYPDAELLGPGKKCGVPQFYLKESSGGKNFVIVKEVP